MPLPDGARYERGSNKRHVILENGTRVSRGEAENLAAQDLGFRNHYEYTQYLSTRRDNKPFQTRDRAAHKKAQQLPTNERREFLQKMRRTEARVFGQVVLGKQRFPDTDPNGELAQYLVDLGLRSPVADYDVGESP